MAQCVPIWLCAPMWRPILFLTSWLRKTSNNFSHHRCTLLKYLLALCTLSHNRSIGISPLRERYCTQNTNDFCIINESKYVTASCKSNQMGGYNFYVEVCNMLRHWWGRWHTSAKHCTHLSGCFCSKQSHMSFPYPK